MSTPGAERIAAERQRQIEHEGYTLDHDAHHHPAELVEAAIAYASPNDGVALWPWEPAGFKPEVRAADLAGVPGHLRHGSVGDLVKAGALIAAAIDRLLTTEPASDHPLTLDEHLTSGERCSPLHGSCALLPGHVGPHHGYPENIAAVERHAVDEHLAEVERRIEARRASAPRGAQHRAMTAVLDVVRAYREEVRRG